MRFNLPAAINQGPWTAAFSLNKLREIAVEEFILPVCSLGTPLEELEAMGQWLLPPLFHEALDDDLKSSIIVRIRECFPEYPSSGNGAHVRVVELPERTPPATSGRSDRILCFSVDTAIEEHGPHLPLGTDTIQSYSVLEPLSREFERVELVQPLDYGQLTWGLPFGFSIDLTAELLSRYVTGYVNALLAWKSPSAMYVVDVHGSITHRAAIVDGLQNSGLRDWTFRWLHEPLAEFASARGDQHAGGVETALVERVSPNLLDPMWWPKRLDALAQGQMTFAKAIELTPDLQQFCRYAVERACNGIIGDINNYYHIDAEILFQRMLTIARQDLRELIAGDCAQSSGADLW